MDPFILINNTKFVEGLVYEASFAGDGAGVIGG